MAGFISRFGSRVYRAAAAAAMTFAAILGASLAMPAAQAATIDFEALSVAGAPVVDNGTYYDVDGLTYTEAGFRFTNLDIAPGDADPNDIAFRSLKSGAQYTGSLALYGVIPGSADPNSPDYVPETTIRLETVSGNLFDITSIDLASLSNVNSDSVPVDFVGTRGDDTTVTQSYTVPIGDGLDGDTLYDLFTVALTGFTNLKKLEWTVERPDVQFDNLDVSEIAPVPVPAALPLFLSALVGMGIVGRKRQKHSA